MRDSLRDCQIVVHVLSIKGNLVSIRLTFVDTISRVFHCKYVYLKHIEINR